MNDTLDLIPQNDSPQVSSKTKKWYFVTNQRNLFYMLGLGLLIPPAGFGDKYYPDTLNCFPGWLPIFPDKVPKAAIETSIQEANHLIPCILEIEITSIKGQVISVGNNGEVSQLDLPAGFTGNEAVVLVPAPVPANWIKTVNFESKDQQNKCIKDASDFSNVDLSTIDMKPAKKMFTTQATSYPWPQQNKLIEPREVPLEKPLAAGSLLAMLTHFANTSELAINAAKLAFDGIELNADTNDKYRFVTTIQGWIQGTGPGDKSGQSTLIYWNLVDSIIQARTNQDVTSPQDIVLGELEKVRDTLDEQGKEAFENLVSDLKGVSKLGGKSFDELFECHSRPLPRSLLMFYLRNNCYELLEFRHGKLNDFDYVMAAILFGVREKWLGLSTELRGGAGLKEACGHRMAAMSHQLAETSIDLGVPPARPESLRELLIEQPWSRKQQEAATLLARQSGWDCIRTRISIGKGEYGMDVDGTGVHFILNGEPKAVKTETDPDAVIKKLESESIPVKLEEEVRKILKG